jgi:hypothetical protein
MVWVLRLGCYDWGTLIRSVFTSFIMLLRGGIDALFAHVHMDVRKYTLNARRTARQSNRALSGGAVDVPACSCNDVFIN